MRGPDSAYRSVCLCKCGDVLQRMRRCALKTKSNDRS